MRWPKQSRLVLGPALVAVLLLGTALPGADGAGPKNRSKSLHQRQAALSARSQSALLSLFALESRLAQARGELSRLRARSEVLRIELEQVRREVAIVEGSLRASERLLGNHLRTLYEEGEPDAIAVLLGATSLDDAVTRLDQLELSARRGADAVSDARDGRSKLRSLAARLATRLREAKALAARAQQTAAALPETRAARAAYLASLARQRQLNARQIAALDSQARQVVERAQAVQAQSGAATPAAPVPVASGPQTLTVAATGYSMPGRTATGLSVGIGVVAVDPSVIPLGTRMTIPGYGEGVAADIGSGVQGYTIDLWFPTVADALAWGRRTVTITLH